MLIQNWTDDMHIQVFNEMVDEKSERKLTVEELYVYSVLFIKSHKDYSVITDVNTIAYIMATEFEDAVRFAAKENNHKIKIRQALRGLIDKSYLKPVYEVDTDNLKNDTKMTLVITEDIEYKYTKIYFNEFKMMKSADELFIFTVAKRFSYGDGFKGSFERWAKVLGVTEKTAQKKLNEVEYKVTTKTDENGDKIQVQSGVVYITRGRYTDKNQQEINLYRHVDFINDKQESTEQEPIEQESQVEEESNESIDQSNQQEPTVAFGSKEDKVVAFDVSKKDKPAMSIKDKVGDSLPF